MGKVLIIGAGGVGTVVAHKCAQNPEVFSEIVIASRTKEKCDRLAEKIGAKNIVTDQVDADSVEQLVELMNRHKPELVINVALPYQDLTIMEACLQCGKRYIQQIQRIKTRNKNRKQKNYRLRRTNYGKMES